MDALRKFKVWIHPGVGRHKPRTQVIACVPCIVAIPGQQSRRGKGRHLDGEINHRRAVIVEVVRAALPIAVDVWACRIFRIRPEIVCLRKEIVWTARFLEERKAVMVTVSILRYFSAALGPFAPPSDKHCSPRPTQFSLARQQRSATSYAEFSPINSHL